MTAPWPPIDPLDRCHAIEIRRGRGDWTYADYYEAGLRDADSFGVVMQRRHYAQCFVDFHVPPGSARRKAWVAESKARADTPPASLSPIPQQARVAA